MYRKEQSSCWGGSSLSKLWSDCSLRISPGQHQRTHPHHPGDQYPSIWGCKCPCPGWHLRALHAGSPISHPNFANCYIWGTAPRILSSANLCEESECLPDHNSHNSHHQESSPSQPGATSDSPMKTLVEYDHGPKKGWILDKLDLQDLQNWSEEEWNQAQVLLWWWKYLFTHSNLDLGKALLIKYYIKLTNKTPFKKHKQQIPPHINNDVKAHLQEMLDIGTIWNHIALGPPEWF